MARKVLISFLGTNKYEECRYISPDKQQSNVVRFIQEALCADICKDWSKNDCVYLFLTEGEKGSRKTNWEGTNYPQSNNNQGADGLQVKLQKLNLQCQIKPKSIPEGFTDEHNQTIFDTVFNVLEDGDHIYLDITNAFRSIPLFGAVLVNYAKFLLTDIHIESVMYGAFEALGPAHQVRQDIPDPADRHAPILHLTEMLRLQEWTIAANDFIYHGNAKQLAELSSRNGFNDLATILQEIGGTFGTVRGKAIINAQVFDNLRKELKIIEEKQKNPAMKRILEKIEQELRKFVANKTTNGFRAVEWCLEHNLIQQGITLLQETIITYLCPILDYRDDIYKGHRETVAKAMNCKKIKTEQWKGVDKQEIMQIHANTEFKKLEPAYNLLKEYRNDINHGGFETLAKSYKEFEEKLRDSLKQVQVHINF